MTAFLFVVKIPVHEDERSSASEEKPGDDSGKKKDSEEEDKPDDKLNVSDDTQDPVDIKSAKSESTKTEKPKEDDLKEDKPKVENYDWDFGEEDKGIQPLGDVLGTDPQESKSGEVSGPAASTVKKISGDTTGAHDETSENVGVSQKQGKDIAIGAISRSNEGESEKDNKTKLEQDTKQNELSENKVKSDSKLENINNEKGRESTDLGEVDTVRPCDKNESVDQNKTDTGQNTTQNVSFADVVKATVNRENNIRQGKEDAELISLDPQPQQCEATEQNKSDTSQKTTQDTSSTNAVKCINSKSENNNIEKGKELSEAISVGPRELGDLDKVEIKFVGEDGEKSTSPPKKIFKVERATEDSLHLGEALDRQNQIEDTVKHLEKSESVPPLRLHGELPVPMSLSDDRLSEVENVNFQTVNFLEDEPLIETVKAIIESFSIDNFSVQKTDNGEFYQVIFVDEGGERCETILNQLAKEKIGDRPGTSISIFPSSIYRGNIPNDAEEDTEEEGEETEDRDEETPFKKSIKARMLVTQVFNTVRDNAQFTFDYLVLCVTASLLACLGLVENSSVILVASMLVSPLMGPILGGTFGTVMQNKSLRELGIKNELIGLFICLISGLLFGIISGIVNIDGAKWGSTDTWPTNEMKSRGVLRSLWVGVCIALPSGAGVALSVLGGNAGSLVGVAISASLLPPAVNAGMLWAYSIISAIRPPDFDVTYKNVTVNNTSFLEEVYTPTDSLGCKPFLNNKYSPAHSCDMATEAAYLGFISLMLTNLNILCIFIMGIAFLKIKQVAPQHTTTDSTRDFWSQDVHVVKESYSTSKGPQSMHLAAQARKLLEEWRNKTGDTAENTLRLKDIIEEVENSPEYNQLLPRIGGHQYSRYLKKDFENAMHEVQEGMVPETRVVEEKTKGGYNVYKTYHGLHPVLRRRHKPHVTFSLEEDSPTKQDTRPMSDGSAHKSSPNKRFSAPLHIKPAALNLNSNLYSRRKKSKEDNSGTQLSRFKVSKVDEEQEDKSPTTDVRDPLLDSNV